MNDTALVHTVSQSVHLSIYCPRSLSLTYFSSPVFPFSPSNLSSIVYLSITPKLLLSDRFLKASFLIQIHACFLLSLYVITKVTSVALL